MKRTTMVQSNLRIIKDANFYLTKFNYPTFGLLVHSQPVPNGTTLPLFLISSVRYLKTLVIINRKPNFDRSIFLKIAFQVFT